MRHLLLSAVTALVLGWASGAVLGQEPATNQPALPPGEAKGAAVVPNPLDYGGSNPCCVQDEKTWGETYFTVGGGYVFPTRLRHVRGTENFNYPNPPGPGDLFPGSALSDLNLASSGAVGVKLGHFLSSVPWLGGEIEYRHFNPNFPRQTVALTNPNFRNLGFGNATFHEDQLPADLSSNLLAFNVVARYPGELFQPYVGVGLGVLFTEVKGTGVSGIILERPGSIDLAPPFSKSATDVFLNTQLGCRLNLTQSLFAFGEWRFDYGTSHLNQFRSLLNVRADATFHTLFFGLGIRFN